MKSANHALSVAPVILFLLTILSPNASSQYGAAGGEWRSYGGDTGNTKYSALDRINRDNAGELRVAWRWKTENLGPRPDFNFQATPLMVDGVLYTTAGARRNVAAIDAATGETLWIYRIVEPRRDGAATRKGSGRGVAYWTDGEQERIIFITRGFRLIALDAKTGRTCPDFGNNGVIDLKEGLDRPVFGGIGSTSPPIIANDVVVVGSSQP
ncbi:MAG: PQQ-binding-like beta-propeller repeat protein, partial [Candidatus Hydrogenedentes bacterium]|nr:PQQ-binding-like beta-propeller repeat protein [Candidatus Hydrogenedentota bacterium]